jgi:hypothetical protein
VQFFIVWPTSFRNLSFIVWCVLCALHKKDGRIRPIAIGNCPRRLTSKLACFQSCNIVNSYLSPHQLGVATKLGCEAAIHTTQTIVNNDQNRGKVLLKLVFKNAVNSVERNCILKEVQCPYPTSLSLSLSML